MDEHFSQKSNKYQGDLYNNKQGSLYGKYGFFSMSDFVPLRIYVPSLSPAGVNLEDMMMETHWLLSHSDCNHLFRWEGVFKTQKYPEYWPSQVKPPCRVQGGCEPLSGCLWIFSLLFSQFVPLISSHHFLAELQSCNLQTFFILMNLNLIRFACDGPYHSFFITCKYYSIFSPAKTFEVLVFLYMFPVKFLLGINTETKQEQLLKQLFH